MDKYKDAPTGEYSIYEIAQRIWRNRSQVYGWYTGKHRPMPENITRISKVTKIPYQVLYDYFSVQYGKEHSNS